MDGRVLVSPGTHFRQKEKTLSETLVPFGAEGETRQGVALSVRCANGPILCPFLLRKKMDGRVLVSPGTRFNTKRKGTKENP